MSNPAMGEVQELRVTAEAIEANMASEHYGSGVDFADNAIVHPGGERYPESLSLLTFCILVLRNGFTVVGYSACASPKTFDAEEGRKYAREEAVRKVWELMEYELKSWLASSK